MTYPTLGKEELLRTIDEGWRAFRSRIRHLGRDGIGRTTPAGWTFKDLVAHVAAWEELATRRLRTFRQTGAQEDAFGDVDAFNARAVAERKLVGAEAILDELEAAHRMLLEEVRRLTEEQIRDGWTQHVIAGNTFGHYEEHREELASIAGS